MSSDDSLITLLCNIARASVGQLVNFLLIQAELINGADILVIPHGAAFGNLIFAPKKSVIVHIGASESACPECPALVIFM